MTLAGNRDGRRRERQDQEGNPEDEAILREAKTRFKRVQDYEADFQVLAIQDIKFANADSTNGWQWPNDTKKERESASKVALTINKTATHVRLVTNDARKNKPSVKVRPIGDKVSYEAAQVWQGLVREIEYRSNAQAIYDNATVSQVECGIGYWRVTHDYVDDDSFDQELRIDPVQDHLSVYLDDEIKQPDGSDARFGFVFESISKDSYEDQYPGQDIPPEASGLDETYSWVFDNDVRVAEYYRIVETSDQLIYVEDASGNAATFRMSSVPREWRKQVEAEAEKLRTGAATSMKRRTIKKRQLEWYKIAGDKIVARRKLKGSYIPIVRLVGIERRIEGKLHRTGLVRPLMDPQRLYNWNSSAEVEAGALATKTKWLAPIDAIAGLNQWDQQNIQNYMYLPYRHKDEDGDPLPPPQPIDPPQPVAVYVEGMKIAAAEMEMASGQYGPQMQNPSIERTPAAVNARQRTGDTATYHFIDQLGIAIRYTGILILDLAPHVYDTERVIKILGDDKELQEVHVKPDIDTAYDEEKERDQIKVLFNPQIGRYAIESDIGPAYQTRRQESWDAFLQIIQHSPELIAMIGDLGFLAADFPMADKIAERIKRNIKANTPWLLDDDAVGPQIQQLQAELADSNKKVAELLQKLAEQHLKQKDHDEGRAVDIYKANTERMHLLGNTVKDMGPDVVKPLIRQTLAEMMGFSLSPLAHEIQEDIDADLQESETAEIEPAAGGE